MSEMNPEQRSESPSPTPNPSAEQSVVPEAKGLAWTTIFTRAGSEVTVSARASNLKSAIDELHDAMSYAMGTYGWTPTRQSRKPEAKQEQPAPPPPVAAPVKPAPVATPPQPPRPPSPPTTSPAQVGNPASKTPPAAGTMGTFIANKLECEPAQKPGSISVKLYGYLDGGSLSKFPIITQTVTKEAMVEYCRDYWADADTSWFDGKLVVDIQATVTYKISDRTKSTGNPYKDIVNIKPLLNT